MLLQLIQWGKNKRKQKIQGRKDAQFFELKTKIKILSNSLINVEIFKEFEQGNDNLLNAQVRFFEDLSMVQAQQDIIDKSWMRYVAPWETISSY